jgi:hypothetical protein
MGLVDDEQADGALDRRQDAAREALVGEAFRRDQEHVDLVAAEAFLDFPPFADIAGVDRRRPQPEPRRHRDLVTHEREQGADDQGRPAALVAPDARRDPVDEALAPAGPLDDERARSVTDDRLDGLALALAELGIRAEHGLEVVDQRR